MTWLGVDLDLAAVRGEYELYVFCYLEQDVPKPVPGPGALGLLLASLLGAGIPALWRR